MKIQERIQTFKPYAGGAVIGIIAAAIVGFSADWIVLKSTMDKEVRVAQVSVLAEVCRQTANAYWQEQGNELAALDGWRNEERKKLAEQFTPSLEQDSFRKAIVDKCDRLLRPA